MSDQRSTRVAAGRVRRLLDHLASPHPGLDHLVGSAERHVQALSPRLAILEVAPLGQVPAVPLAATPPSAEPPAARKRRSPTTEPQPQRRMRPTLVTDAPPPTRRNAGRDAAVADRTRPPVLPVAAARTGTTDSGQPRSFAPPDPARGHPRPFPGGAAAVAAAGVHTAREPAVSRDAPAADRQPVLEGMARLPGPTGRDLADLGALAERALRQSLARSAGTPVSSIGPRATGNPLAASGQPRRGAAETGRGGGPTGPGESSARGSAAYLPQHATTLLGEAQRAALAAHRPVASLVDATADGHRAAPVSAAGAAPAAPVFIFDPLARRASAAASDEVLADRVGQLLHEEARRRGVDVT